MFRINNRGPPRISDLPPLPPDFDTPGMNPPPLPADHPYPFEKPPAPERPSVNQLPPVHERPSPGRPYMPDTNLPQNNRPWTRPSHRPGNNRRPIPPYKPMPPQDSSFYLDNDDKPVPKPIDMSTNHSINDKELSSQSDNTKQSITQDEIITKKQTKYQPPLKQDKVVAEDTLILGSDLQPIPIPTHGENSAKPVNSQETSASHKTSIISSETNAETKSTHLTESTSSIPRNVTMTTLRVETSSSVQVIASTRTTIEIQPSIVPLESNTETTLRPIISTASNLQTTILESSRVTEEPNNNHVSTPTDGLGTKLLTTKSSTAEITRTTPVATFYKTSGNYFS